jgi:hypothetical protein
VEGLSDVGNIDGQTVGENDGLEEDGIILGSVVGPTDGRTVGATVGPGVGIDMVKLMESSTWFTSKSSHGIST